LWPTVLKSISPTISIQSKTVSTFPLTRSRKMPIVEHEQEFVKPQRD
jgi:hypothetical protein